MPFDESPEDEIRRFEEQFRQQPESLVFARLADAHRKAGDPHRALEVLEEGIRRHTDYLSAHIVRARTYLDLGRVEDAGAAFERVIEIDPQNLVAIRGLAEIARAADDPIAEIPWLERLVLADPQNPEPGERLEMLRQEVEMEVQAEPEPESDETLESAPVDETWWNEEPASTAGESPLADSDLASELWSGPAAIPESEPDPVLESGPDLGGESEDAEDASSLDAAGEWDEAFETLMDSFDGEQIDDFAADEAPAAEPQSKDAWWFESPEEEAAPQSGDQAESDEDADLLTRTMAELYARQGLIDEAEAIYRELLRDRPDDESLRDGLDAVLGIRAARGATRSSDILPEPEVAELEVAELEVAGEEVAEQQVAGEQATTEPAPLSVGDSLADLLRAGETLAHRLPEPPEPPAGPAQADETVDTGSDLEAPPEAEEIGESPAERPVLKEWLRGLRS